MMSIFTDFHQILPILDHRKTHAISFAIYFLREHVGIVRACSLHNAERACLHTATDKICWCMIRLSVYSDLFNLF